VGQNIGDIMGEHISRTMQDYISVRLATGIAGTFGGTLLAAGGGALAGGLVSGVIGMISQLLFPVEQPIREEIDAVEENTRAIRELNDTFRDFTERYIGAPPSFIMPSLGSGSRSGNVNIIINPPPGMSPGDVAGEVANIINYGSGGEYSGSY